MAKTLPSLTNLEVVFYQKPTHLVPDPYHTGKIRSSSVSILHTLKTLLSLIKEHVDTILRAIYTFHTYFTPFHKVVIIVVYMLKARVQKDHNTI